MTSLEKAIVESLAGTGEIRDMLTAAIRSLLERGPYDLERALTLLGARAPWSYDLERARLRLAATIPTGVLPALRRNLRDLCWRARAPRERQVVKPDNSAVGEFTLERAEREEQIGGIQDEWELRGLPIKGQFPPAHLGVLSARAVWGLSAYTFDTADEKRVLVILACSTRRTAMAEFVLDGEEWAPVHRHWRIAQNAFEHEHFSLRNAAVLPLVQPPGEHSVRCGTAVIQSVGENSHLSPIEINRPGCHEGPLGLRFDTPVRYVCIWARPLAYYCISPMRVTEVSDAARLYRSRVQNSGRFLLLEIPGAFPPTNPSE
jgi:hypothetical protein